jgi:hypothetical protein
LGRLGGQQAEQLLLHRRDALSAQPGAIVTGTASV